jgi:hypothetical protein
MTLLLAGALASTGCSKQKPVPMVVQGVSVDLPKLREAFATASPEMQIGVGEVVMGVRYGDYPRAFAGLDKLAKASDLTDVQKKTVAEVAAQMKEAASKTPTAPPR